MSGSNSNFAIARLNNQNITDVGIKNQGQQLLKIVSIDSTWPQWVPAGITSALANSDLAFTESGSLFALKKKTAFYNSPFYMGTTPETPGNVNLIGGNTLFSPIKRGVSTNAQGLLGTIYVSPYQGKFILQSTKDDNGGQVYNVYYNPINRSDVDDATIDQNLFEYCKMVNFADPTCFCQNNSEACGNMVSAGNYKSLSADDRKSLGDNCALLSPMCQKWAQYGNKFTTDEIKASNKANPDGVPICGNKFTYADGGLTSSNGDGLLQSCKLQAKPTTPPSVVPVSTQPDGQPVTTQPPPKPADDKKKMSPAIIAAIVIAILIIVVLVGLYI